MLHIPKRVCYDKNEKKNKKNLKYTKELEIVVFILENLDEPLIAFVI